MPVLCARRWRGVLSSAALVAGLVAGPGVPAALAVSDTAIAGSAGAIAFHPFTMPPNPGCVQWHEDGTYNCDPVNVIFPNRSPGQVRDLLRGKGWTTAEIGSTQYLHFATPTLYADRVQLFRPDGRNRLGRRLRYHVRLWRVRGLKATVTVGAVHHEVRSRFRDRIDRSWNASERFLSRQLCRGGCSRTGPLAKQNQMQGGDGEWRGWANDARATLIP